MFGSANKELTLHCSEHLVFAFEVENKKKIVTSERKITANPKQYDHKKEKGMSTSYQRFPRSENYKENSTSVVHRSREEALKEMEKYNARIPPEVKIIASKIEGPTRQHDNPVLMEYAEYIINLINSGGIEGPTEQPINPVLSEDDKYIIRVITSGGIEGPGRRRVNPVLTEEQEAAWRE